MKRGTFGVPFILKKMDAALEGSSPAPCGDGGGGRGEDVADAVAVVVPPLYGRLRLRDTRGNSVKVRDTDMPSSPLTGATRTYSNCVDRANEPAPSNTTWEQYRQLTKSNQIHPQRSDHVSNRELRSCPLFLLPKYPQSCH